MKFRTIYLQKRLSITGRNALVGRALFDKFKELSEEIILCHCIFNDDQYANFKELEVKRDILSYSIVREFKPNIIYLEGGLFLDRKGTWRIPKDIALEVMDYGCSIVIADVDSNEFMDNKEHYRNASSFLNATALYHVALYGINDSKFPVYGLDATRNWKGQRQILCKPEKMIISDWLRAIYSDIPEIIVGLPVRLSSWDSLLASCNSDTSSTLHQDRWVETIDSCPFGSVTQQGAGFVALLAGAVSDDVWLSGCIHNTNWLTNIARFLANEGRIEQQRRISHYKSPYSVFLSHRSTDKKFVRQVADEIKSRGVRIWFDEENLIPSQSLVEEISCALGKMTHFILFWSIDCVGARWVEREMNSGISQLINHNIPLIIVRLDNTPIPPIISDIYRIESIGAKPKDVGRRIVDSIERLSKLKRQSR